MVNVRPLPSPVDGGPFDDEEVRNFARSILGTGTLSFSKHALEEMENDGLQTTDVANVLMAGWTEPAEKVAGTWRYRFRTNRMCVVIALRSRAHAVVVTAWRLL